MKQVMLLLILMLALVACGGGNGGDTSSDDPNFIKMNATKFIPEAVTIAPNTSITLKADAFVPHFIANGTWEGDSAIIEREEGAPVVDNLQIQGGQEGTIGPFTESGTFEFYCTIHPGMNLTVTVE